MRQQSQLERFGQDKQTIEARVIRAATHGRMLNEPPEPAPGGPGFRKPSTGRFVGYRFEEPGVERQSDSGQFTATGDGRAISKREAIARYGHPDGEDGDVPPSPFGQSPRPQTYDGQANDQLEAGVDRDQLHRTELFGAQAQQQDVSLSPDEAFDGVGSGGIAQHSRGDVPVTDQFGRFDATPEEEAADLDRIASERQRGVEAVEEFNRGDMGLRELGSELEQSGHDSGGFLNSPPELTEGDDPFLVGNPGEFNSPYKSKDKDKYD